MSLQGMVTVTALGMSVLCFALFAAQSLGIGSAKPTGPARQVAERAKGLTPASVGEMTELVKSLATLSDSLGKAGPALTSLIGSVLLMSIAAVASGALVGKPPTAPSAASKPAPAGTHAATGGPAATGEPAATGTPAGTSTAAATGTPTRATLPRQAHP